MRKKPPIRLVKADSLLKRAAKRATVAAVAGALAAGATAGAVYHGSRLIEGGEMKAKAEIAVPHGAAVAAGKKYTVAVLRENLKKTGIDTVVIEPQIIEKMLRNVSGGEKERIRKLLGDEMEKIRKAAARGDILGIESAIPQYKKDIIARMIAGKAGYPKSRKMAGFFGLIVGILTGMFVYQRRPQNKSSVSKIF